MYVAACNAWMGLYRKYLIKCYVSWKLQDSRFKIQDVLTIITWKHKEQYLILCNTFCKLQTNWIKSTMYFIFRADQWSLKRIIESRFIYFWGIKGINLTNRVLVSLAISSKCYDRQTDRQTRTHIHREINRQRGGGGGRGRGEPNQNFSQLHNTCFGGINIFQTIMLCIFIVCILLHRKYY